MSIAPPLNYETFNPRMSGLETDDLVMAVLHLQSRIMLQRKSMLWDTMMAALPGVVSLMTRDVYSVKDAVILTRRCAEMLYKDVFEAVEDEPVSLDREIFKII